VTPRTTDFFSFAMRTTFRALDRSNLRLEFLFMRNWPTV